MPRRGRPRKGTAIYLCERCGSKFSSARFATIELCPRCLLRDDAASHLVFIPADRRHPAPPKDARPEPDTANADPG